MGKFRKRERTCPYCSKAIQPNQQGLLVSETWQKPTWAHESCVNFASMKMEEHLGLPREEDPLARR
jgi:hypothetical protein